MSPRSTRQSNKRKRKDKQQPSATKRLRPNDDVRHSSEANSQQGPPEDAKKHVMQLWKNIIQDVSQKASNKYVYTPLKEKYSQDIRVLIIEPGKQNEPIRCRLVPSALNKTRAEAGTPAHRFVALSYFWGEGDPIHHITLTSYAKPRRMLKDLSSEELENTRLQKGKNWTPTGTIQVRKNLYRALQRFRNETKQVTMWIDALCIDQEDEHERSAQVKKMHELYINAKNVRIWLGTGEEEEEPSPEHCFQFLRKLLDLKNLESTIGNGSEDEFDFAQNAGNIMSLMCNKWFSRRWVLQELALARKAEVVYGKEKMGWSDFSDAIAIFIKSFDLTRSILKKIVRKHLDSPETLATTDGVKNMGANVLVEFTNNLFRRSERGKMQQRIMTLEGLVSSLLAFEATDPRDTIYAVLSLAKDTYQLSADSDENAGFFSFDPRLQPDYKNKSLSHVYTEFIDYCIEKSSSLDILFRHWAPSMRRNKSQFPQSDVPTVGALYKKEDSLPSWIPPLHNSSHGTPDQRNRGRSNGDSFVGASYRSGQRNYSAASDLMPEYEFGSEEQSRGHRVIKRYNGHLSITGLHIGTVQQVARRAAYGVIFNDAFEIAGFELEHWKECKQWAPGKPRVPEEFWRTLVGDRGPSGSNPPCWYPRACLDCLNKLLPSGDLKPDEVIASENTSTITKEFLERVKNVIWERRFGRVHLKVSKQPRYTFGLFPAKTKEDDLVCILFGSSVPVILRPLSKGQKIYTMVGECFVYGMMEGEAVSGKSWQQSYEGAESFELV